MDYNTTQKKIILPEYGRNIQKMAEYLFEIEDRDERTKAAHELVSIMINMSPAVKDTKDHKQKIWDFLAQMCEYKLDIDYPFEIMNVAELANTERLPYTTGKIKYRHYGLMIERLISAACDYEEGEEKVQLIKMIANHMKKTYVAWNKKSVNDSIIINDLYHISQGKLVLDEDTKLMHVVVAPPKPASNNYGKKKNKNRKKK
ncbi:MAG: DUF4290 domain-containing protein [Bacteroidales bacterium]|jgi:hypothetical protein|nr:DUF4290 domain-containing protein [Bacteroidales bacterium]